MTVGITEIITGPEAAFVLDAAFYNEAEDILKKINPDGTQATFRYYSERNGLAARYGAHLGGRLFELFKDIEIEARPNIGEPFQAAIQTGEVQSGESQIEPLWHVDRAIGLRKYFGSYSKEDDSVLTKFAHGTVVGSHPLNASFRELFIRQSRASLAEFSSLVDQLIIDEVLDYSSAESRTIYDLREIIHRSGTNNTNRTVNRTAIAIMTA